MITRVLCDPKAVYYAMEQSIDPACRTLRERQRARRLYRFLVAVSASEIACDKGLSEGEEAAVRAFKPCCKGAKVTVGRRVVSAEMPGTGGTLILEGLSQAFILTGRNVPDLNVKLLLR